MFGTETIDKVKLLLLYGFRCTIPSCDRLTVNGSFEYVTDWLHFAVPFKEDGKPVSCQRFQYVADEENNPECNEFAFNQSVIETCDEFVFAQGELTIVNEVFISQQYLFRSGVDIYNSFIQSV